MGAIARSLRLHGGLPKGTAITIENALNEILNVEMIDAEDVTGGGTTQTVGFRITDFSGSPIAGEFVVEMGVFDHFWCGVPSGVGTLDNASKGTIIAGAGSSTIKLRTDADGQFECELTGATGLDFFLACAPSFRSSVLDCRQIDSVSFF